MAKNIFISFLVLLLVISTGNAIPQPRIDQVYLKEIGVREKTGNNDGERVETYQRSTGTYHVAWCASFVKWCFDQAHVITTITAWSPTAHNPDNIVWFHLKFLKEPQSGDVGTIWFPSKRRIAHTFFFHRKINDSIYESVEGNTNGGGSRDGDGVYKRRRSFRATYSITRWLK